MFTKKFLKDLAERSLRTFGQGAASYLTLMGLDVIKADVKSAVYGGLIAGGFAVVTALAAYFKKPEQESASLLDQPVVTEPGRHDGSQAPYVAKTEGYNGNVANLSGPPIRVTQTNAPGVEPDVPVRSQQPMGFVGGQGGQIEPQVSFPPPVRQRDPHTGRFLPRNQGEV